MDGLPLDVNKLDSTMIELGIGCFARNSMSGSWVLYMLSVRVDIFKSVGVVSQASLMIRFMAGMYARLRGCDFSVWILSKMIPASGEGGYSTLSLSAVAIQETRLE